MVPEELTVADLAGANAKGTLWCEEVNGVTHSEICAVPAERLAAERKLFTELPSLRAVIGKGDNPKGGPVELCPVRVGSLLGAQRPHREDRGAPGKGRGDRDRVPGRDRRRAPGRFPDLRFLAVSGSKECGEATPSAMQPDRSGCLRAIECHGQLVDRKAIPCHKDQGLPVGWPKEAKGDTN
jgi:hypothetical protein